VNWRTKTTLAIWIVGLLLLSLIVVTSVKSPMFGAQGDRSNGDPVTPSTLPLDSLDGLDVTAVHEAGLDPGKVTANITSYRGRQALQLLNDDSQIAKGNPTGGQSLAIVKGSDFKDGTIEVEVVGLPREGAPADTRGFVGVAFRVQDRGARFEAFYLRFTNGRAENQLQRNHATQYVSEPDFPWFRLRKENPGEYESYVDIEPKAWTKLKIAVLGTKAQLYVNGALQPCLIVDDLKLGAVRGQVALWNGSDTEAYFSNLRIQ
jgi:hypothetical protein